MPERQLKGRIASPGLAAGRAKNWEPRIQWRTFVGDAESEALQLRRAITAAAASIEALAASSESQAAEILRFQCALLHDATLCEPAYTAIASGTSADRAWAQALDLEIADYEASPDENFRARAGDLRDLKWRVLNAMSGSVHEAGVPAGSVVFSDDLPPSAFLGFDWSHGGAIVLSGGSSASHLAMLARSRGVPMIVGTGVNVGAVEGEALVDADKGVVLLEAAPATREAFMQRYRQALAARSVAEASVAQTAVTRDGTRVEILLNITDARELDQMSPEVCDGVGLVRSEFLFGGARLPDEEHQYQTYSRIVNWAQARPVTIRTLDAGGDKPMAGLTAGGESNPALGLRGVRLSLARPDVFRVQLRALARAAMHGQLRIMIPMVTVPAELASVRAILDDELLKMAREGVAARRPPVGMMVEVPAAALTVEQFDADFFSIGSNDLVQYITAAARDLGSVADLANPLHPAVLQLISRVVACCNAMNRDVSLCGDAAADPAVIPHLLASGLRSFSVAPAAIATTKAAVRGTDFVSLGGISKGAP